MQTANKVVFIAELNIRTIKDLYQCQLCLHSPGYFPPLFRWMKQIISRIKMSRAMAHMRPMNHPWVAMSTCLLATAGQGGESET